MQVTVRVPAKINLQLSVGPRRADGYHELATVFCAVSLYDEVTVEPSSSPRLTADGPYAGGVPLDDSNLAVQAVRLLAAEAGIQPDVSMHLHKRIPAAGGMAGGSADAAGALIAAAQVWGLEVPGPRLLDLAAGLGSDVPFALHGGAAVGTGRGERLVPLPPGPAYRWVLAIAAEGLSTREVFEQFDRSGAGSAASPPAVSADLLTALSTGDPEALGAALTNDLQPAALALRPELAGTLQAGLDAGAVAALLSGSGPTCVFLDSGNRTGAAVPLRLEAEPSVRSVLVVEGPVPGPATTGR